MNDNNQSKVSLFGEVAGVLLVVAVILDIVFYYKITRPDTFLLLGKSQTLSFIAYIVLAIALFRKKKDLLPVITSAIIAVLPLTAFLGRLLHIGSRFVIGRPITRFLQSLSAIAIFAIIAIALTDYFKPLKSTVKACWFVPAILMTLTAIGTYIFYWGGSALALLTRAIAFAFIGLWATNDLTVQQPITSPDTVSANNTTCGNAVVSTPVNNAYCDLVKHILLLLFTFGIWYFVWIYRITGYLNCVENEEPRNPTNKLLLCMFVPFYSIYWVYKSAQRIDKLAAKKSVSSDLSTLCLILAIFVGIIPPILMQEKINTIIKAEDAPIGQQTPAQAPKATLGTAEELKTYKELLDSGVITQEEFEAKKKQLLGL